MDGHVTVPLRLVHPNTRTFDIRNSTLDTETMADSENVHTFTETNFKEEVLDADEPVLVDFWAEWCGPCRQVAPIVEDLADDFAGRAKVGKVDVDANQRIAAQYGIRSIPSLIIFRDGEPVEQMVGVTPKNQLAEKLDGALA
jgi:thioredoxin 1